MTLESTTLAIRSRLGDVLERYPWSFIGFLVLCQVVPSFYSLTNTYWIGHISNNALAITEQYEFLSVTIQIVNDTIPFGVLALVAQNFHDKERVISILKTGFIVQLIFSTALMVGTLVFLPQFVSSIGTPAQIVASTKSYLTLQSIALPFNSLALLLLTAIQSMRKAKESLYIITISIVLNMVMDLFLISNTSFSLHWGIEGSAFDYVISQVVIFVASAVYLAKILSIKLTSFSFSDLGVWLRPLFGIGGWTGLDSVVRNIGYILVPLNVLNVIGVNPYGGYELAMTVMWTLIIPMLAITQGTNIVIGNLYGERNYPDLKRALLASVLIVTGIMIAIAVIGIFLWNDMSAFFNQNPAMVYYSTQTFWWMMIPYVLYGIGSVLKSVFYGTGITKYICYISSWCNFGLIIPFWILARLGYITASFTNVMTLFVIVFAIDLIITLPYLRGVMRDVKARSASRVAPISV